MTQTWCIIEVGEANQLLIIAIYRENSYNYALWWEVFPLGMSANLMTWWWLQSVGDGCKVWRWQIVVLAIVKIKNLNKPNVPMPAHTYSNLQFVSFWVYFHSSKSHSVRFCWLTMERYPFTHRLDVHNRTHNKVKCHTRIFCCIQIYHHSVERLSLCWQKMEKHSNS